MTDIILWLFVGLFLGIIFSCFICLISNKRVREETKKQCLAIPTLYSLVTIIDEEIEINYTGEIAIFYKTIKENAILCKQNGGIILQTNGLVILYDKDYNLICQYILFANGRQEEITIDCCPFF